MRKEFVRTMAGTLAGVVLLGNIPAMALEEQAETRSAIQVVADWKLGSEFAKEGTQITDGSLVIEDQSGNGNDLEMQLYQNKNLTEQTDVDTWDNYLSFSDDDMNHSGDGSMAFNGDSINGNGAALVTTADAAINSEAFSDGYTIEFLYYFPDDWTEADRWMGLLSRQTSYTNNGNGNFSFPENSMDEPQLGSMSVAVSNCKEVQFLTAPENDDHKMSSAAWSVTMDQGGVWYHIAVTSDGEVIRTYVNGCEAFRDYASDEMDGMFVDPNDGRFRIGASWYVERKNGVDKVLDKFLQGNLQEVRITQGALQQEDWLIPNPTDYAGSYGSNEAYTLKHDDNYNFVLLPDTQNTVKFKPEVMDTALKELISTAEDLNVAGVVHLGDVVENGRRYEPEELRKTQYENARDLFYQLPEAGIKLLVQPGNHDDWAGDGYHYGAYFGAESADWTNLTSSYLTSKSWSSYMVISAGSYDYLVISLATTDGTTNWSQWTGEIDWFKKVIADHPNMPTIVTTHYLQDCSDTTPSAVKLGGRGNAMWDMIKDEDQVFMMVGGHMHGAGVEVLRNNKGHEVISILTDYQFAYNGGNGIFRYLEFDETDNKIYYNSYSPYAASLREDEKSFFDVNFLSGDGNRGEIPLNFSKRFAGMEVENKKIDDATEGKWMTGEYHTHTGTSKDATESYMKLANVLGVAFRNNEIIKNLPSAAKAKSIENGEAYDFLFLADHLRRSYNGIDGKATSYTTPFYQAVQKQITGVKQLQNEGGPYSDKLIYSGFEWDMPALDHATVGIIDPESDDVPIDAIHEFEWKYAHATGDNANSGDDPTAMFHENEQDLYGERLNTNGATAEVAYDAAAWLQENYPESYALPNHPSRHNGQSGEVKIENLRRLNDAAPDIVFGMEGLPGNQMDPSCELSGYTYGGADEMIAKTGGVWDTLLSEGRRFWNFANADFHFKVSTNGSYASGYWPSEYSRNYIWVETGDNDTYEVRDVVAGMRSGNSYSVYGELISDLDFSVSSSGNTATMGGDLTATKGKNATVTIRYRVPDFNNYSSINGNTTEFNANNYPQIDHIDLISGSVTGKAAEEDYATIQSDARIVKTFAADELGTPDADGYYTLTYTTTIDNDCYFRVRGLSSATVDDNGDPVADSKNVSSNAAVRQDQVNDQNYTNLSFYANPIFVTAKTSSGSGQSSSSSSSSSSVPLSTTQYPASVSEINGGNVSLSVDKAASGNTITITATPESGKQVVSVKVFDQSGKEVAVTKNSNGTYSFKMPSGGAQVSAEFADIKKPDNNEFSDVTPNDYFSNAVNWAVLNKIASGINDTTFAPDDVSTRAQAVTFLWRAMGSPDAVSNVNPFRDVSASAYYYKAVLWANEKQITSGISGDLFGPDQPVTRAQVSTLLWRAGGKPVITNANIFSDVPTNAYYFDAVGWAAEKGITTGTSATTFTPANPCTRAQIVTFLFRYLNK